MAAKIGNRYDSALTSAAVLLTPAKRALSADNLTAKAFWLLIEPMEVNATMTVSIE
jgi:hypothetical protein